MKVLQYIPKSLCRAPLRMSENVGTMEAYVSTLTKAMDGYAQVTLTSTLTALRRSADEMQPDIIHVHGCECYSAAKAVLWAVQQGIPVVLSLHGGLMPWQWQQHSLVTNSIRKYAYLEKAVREADALHVNGEMEKKWMEELKWNPRLEMVYNSLITNQTTPQRMAARMMKLYQKVIDSNTFRLMSEEEKQTESTLLRIGIEHQYTDQLSPLAAQLSSLTPSLDSWRKILLHSGDERILDYILNATQCLELQVPMDIETQATPRFPQKLQKPQGDLPTDHLLARHALKTKSTLDHLRQDENPSENEMALCYLLLNIQHASRHAQLSRRHLAQCFALIRYHDLDEDKVQRMVQRLKLESFTGALLQILHESLELEEGFMPIEPRDDKTTKHIRNILKNLNIQ